MLAQETNSDTSPQPQSSASRVRDFSKFTLDPADVMKPIHDKTTPLIPATPEEIETWLTAPMDEALNHRMARSPSLQY